MLQLNFSPFPEMMTERLFLRRMTQQDAPEVFFLRSDESVMKYITREPATTIKEAEDFITRIDKGIDNNVAIMWAITLKEDPAKLIGNMCLWEIRSEGYRAEIGYVLHPEHWKKGITKEALLKVVEYGFNTLKLHSFDAHVNPRNAGSIAVLEAAGFTREAYFREAVFFRDQFLDDAVYCRLASGL